MTPTEFLQNRNIVLEDKTDLIIGFENGTKESLIELLDSYHQAKLDLLKSPEVISGSFTDSDIGKEFEIVGNSNDHGFERGEVVTLSEKNKIDKGDERRFDSKEDYWWCIPEDVRKL